MRRLRANWLLAAFRGLAALLAGALLVIELLATDGQFHQTLHAGGKANGNSCLLCLFAKGHVDLPESVEVQPAQVHTRVELVVRVETVTPLDLSYLAFPSRAPPATALASSIVA